MIKTFSKLLAASAVVLLSTSLAARAAMASGTYTNLTMGTLVSLWDISGQYLVDDADLGSLDTTVTNEPSGKYTGLGTVDVDTTFEYKGVSIPIDLSGSVTVSGAVSGSSEKPSASMKLDYSTNNITVDGYDIKSAKEKFDGKFALDSTNKELLGGGTINFTVDFKNSKTGKYETVSKSKAIKDREIPLPSETTGDWTLVLTLTPDENDSTKYNSDSSSAEIITSATNEVDFVVTGTYSKKTDKSTLTLKDTTKGSDCNLSMDVSAPTEDTLTIDSLRGKVFGQTLSYKLKEPKD